MGKLSCIRCADKMEATWLHGGRKLRAPESFLLREEPVAISRNILACYSMNTSLLKCRWSARFASLFDSPDVRERSGWLLGGRSVCVGAQGFRGSLGNFPARLECLGDE